MLYCFFNLLLYFFFQFVSLILINDKIVDLGWFHGSSVVCYCDIYQHLRASEPYFSSFSFFLFNFNLHFYFWFSFQLLEFWGKSAVCIMQMSQLVPLVYCFWWQLTLVVTCLGYLAIVTPVQLDHHIFRFFHKISTTFLIVGVFQFLFLLVGSIVGILWEICSLHHANVSIGTLSLWFLVALDTGVTFCGYLVIVTPMQFDAVVCYCDIYQHLRASELHFSSFCFSFFLILFFLVVCNVCIPLLFSCENNQIANAKITSL